MKAASPPDTMNSRPLGGRYQVIRQLGAGGFSCTFLVKDLHLPNTPRCVLKQLKPQTRNFEALDMARRLFDTEARVLYKLGNHPQIPSLLAHFEDSQEFYLAQEFIEGARLSEEFTKGVSWPEKRVTLLLKEILEVLAFVHRQQVIHRDIKPSNLIRRAQDGRIVLIDFGAVKQVSTSSIYDAELGNTNLTVAIGTQGYMPNEQYAGKPRFSSDVYAVGILGIRALTGVLPHKIDEHPETSELDWQKLAPGISPELATVIDKMVRYDFRHRYPTAVEALAALCAIPGVGTGKVQNVSITPSSSKDMIGAENGHGFEANGIGGPWSDAAEETTNTLLFTGTDESAHDLTRISSGGAKENPERHKPTYWRRWLLLSALLSLGGIAAVDLLWRQQRLQFTPLRAMSEFRLPQPSVAWLGVLTQEQLAEFYVDQGERLRAEGKDLEALKSYSMAIQVKADYAPAYLGRCHSFLALERSNEAIVACNDALAYKGYYPEAVRNIGNALEQQGRLFEALSYYERTNRQMPAMFDAWLDRGRVLQALGRSAEAIRALEQAIARDRNSAQAWAILGEANLSLRRFNQAIVAFDKALMLQPDHPEALEMRRQLRQELGR